MQTPGPGCLEKALSSDIYVNTSKYPVESFTQPWTNADIKKSEFQLDDGVLNRTEV